MVRVAAAINSAICLALIVALVFTMNRVNEVQAKLAALEAKAVSPHFETAEYIGLLGTKATLLLDQRNGIVYRLYVDPNTKIEWWGAMNRGLVDQKKP